MSATTRVTIPGYSVGRKLGAGGMATVFLARRVATGEEVALKLMAPSLQAEPGFAARFVREARIMQGLDHPGIARVIDVGALEHASYIVIEYVRGGDLNARRADGIGADDAVDVVCQVADALSYAHRGGFAHRDVKPENILFREDGTPVLSDFGIAKALHSSTRVTATGMSIGTPYYMSPEQARGDEITAATDFYALGVVLYEMLTGKRPYDADDTFAIALQHINSPIPTLPRERDRYQILIDNLMAKDPADRYQSADQLRRDVARLRAGETVRRPKHALTRPLARASARRMRPALLWAVAGALAAVALAGGAYVLVDRDGVERVEGPAGNDGLPGLPDVVTEPPPPVIVKEPVLGGLALLLVETEPPAVQVLVDEQLVGETPLERNDLRSGVRRLELRHPHYETLLLGDQHLVDDEVLHIQRTLARAQGGLTIVATPRDAWVEHQGRRLADRTPVTLSALPAGPVTLTLGSPEHRAVEVHADVRKDRTTQVEATLTPIPHGTLTLDLTPGDARVIFADSGAPYRPGMRLPDAEYRLSARRAGFRDASRTVTVAGDTRQMLTLERLPSFTVSTVPEWATVTFVGGDGADRAYEAGMGLGQGDYGIRVAAPGFHASERTIRHMGSPTSVEIALEPLGTKPGDRFQDELRLGGKGPWMIVVPAGSFLMGSPPSEAGRFEDEGPRQSVFIREAFAIGAYEVTFAEWDACVVRGGCRGYAPGDQGWGRDDRPVVNVSWDDVQTYLTWLTVETGLAYRLPSESEWEYAARAGTETPFHFGSSVSAANANYNGLFVYEEGSRGEYRQKTMPVGALRPNGFGLHHVHGNVGEWVEDCWNESLAGVPPDGRARTKGDCTRRVLRGGSWSSKPWNARSAYRMKYSRESRTMVNGFRVARPLVTPAGSRHSERIARGEGGAAGRRGQPDR